jgi:hypothetical protein
MEYMLAHSNPAELARIITGLTSPAARVRLANGETMFRVLDSIPRDANPSFSRTPVDRLFQAALMNYAVGPGSYSNRTDFGADHQGLYALEQARALWGLFGTPPIYRTRPDLAEEILSRCSGETLVDLKDGESFGHAVTVERIEGGRVYFRDPNGPRGPTGGESRPDLPRRLERAETAQWSISIEDYNARFKSAYFTIERMQCTSPAA